MGMMTRKMTFSILALLPRRAVVSYIACLFALFAPLMATGTCFAQQTNPTDDGPIVKQFLHDEWKIWSSPAHVRRSDAPWIGGLAVGSAILLKTDRNISWEVAETDDWTRPSHLVSSLGNGIPVLVAPVGILAVGKLTHNSDVSKTGTLGLIAVGHATVVSQVVKQISGRERPMTGAGLGQFRKGGSSFPSGHAMTSWALATVVARRSNNKWVKLGSYSFAAAVGLSRVGGRNHFPSDVLVGSATGYLIGRYVTRDR
jgi:membrane-associated phospholipid phosphatase